MSPERAAEAGPEGPRRGRAGEVLLAFARLGQGDCRQFGAGLGHLNLHRKSGPETGFATSVAGQ